MILEMLNIRLIMKKLKTIITAVALLLSVPFMQSCLDENDQFDNLASEMPSDATMATIITPSEIKGETIIDDDKTGHAYVVNPDILINKNANNPGQRIFYSYKSAESPKGPTDSRAPFIGITWMLKVLTKDMDTLTVEKDHLFGNDPINLKGIYVSKKHLNLQFQILGYNPNIKHRISLVAPLDAKPDAKGYLSVELRHNAEEDAPMNPSFGYVSFILESAPGFKEGTLKGFIIKNKTMNSETETTEVSLQNISPKGLNFKFEYPSNTKTK